jgi:tellurite resistance protein
MDPLVELNLTRTGATMDSSTFISSLYSAYGGGWKLRSIPPNSFYGPGSKLNLQQVELDSPLVYACEGALHDAPDASLIEFGLPTKLARAQPAQLPYWPSYRKATPSQRTIYLNWLIGGRSDPHTEIGYVFIYFYGLERRVLIDTADHTAVTAELLRLLRIYRRSASFQRYAQGLLWTTIWLSRKGQSVPLRLVAEAINATDWNDAALSLCLTCFASGGRPLPDEVVYQVIQRDVRAPRTGVVQRHYELHKQAFMKRLHEKYPDGVRLSTAQPERRLEYFPASPSLGRINDEGGPMAKERLPTIEGMSQFTEILKLWEDSIEDLRAYDRAHMKATRGKVTVEMYQALPEHLRDGDHPHFEQWCRLLDRSVTNDGWTIMSIADFATLEGISERPKLTKTQSLDLAESATQMGFALEPDPRITGTPYTWNQQVSVFPATDELSQNVASYHAAALLLELGVAIAAADGVLDDIELGRLTSHLESQFELSTQDSCRLEHLRYLLVKSPPTDFAPAKTMQAKLTRDQRQQIGEFLVGIAAADEEISPDEVRALTTAYRQLGLARTDLDDLLHAVESNSQPSEPDQRSAQTFRLDPERISAIMAETEQVTRFLREAMRDSEADDLQSELIENAATNATPVNAITAPEPTPAQPQQPTSNNLTTADSPPQGRWDNLPNDLRPFVEAAVAQTAWKRSSLDQLARTHRLLLGSAIERTNEWAYDAFGDALFVEDGDEFTVQVALLP